MITIKNIMIEIIDIINKIDRDNKNKHKKLKMAVIDSSIDKINIIKKEIKALEDDKKIRTI